MASISVQGISFDAHSSFQQGAAKAPGLIRKAFYSDSGNSYSENLTLIDSSVFYDAGDFTIEKYFDIESITRANLQKTGKLLTLGGDHSENKSEKKKLDEKKNVKISRK